MEPKRMHACCRALLVVIVRLNLSVACGVRNEYTETVIVFFCHTSTICIIVTVGAVAADFIWFVVVLAVRICRIFTSPVPFGVLLIIFHGLQHPYRVSCTGMDPRSLTASGDA